MPKEFGDTKCKARRKDSGPGLTLQTEMINWGTFSIASIVRIDSVVFMCS